MNHLYSQKKYCQEATLCDILGGLTPPFFMDILVYTTSGCKYCSQVKELLQRADLEYKEVLVNTPELKMEMVSKYPQAKTYPHVIIDGESVGGLVDTAKLFLEKGLVKAKSK